MSIFETKEFWVYWTKAWLWVLVIALGFLMLLAGLGVLKTTCP